MFTKFLLALLIVGTAQAQSYAHKAVAAVIVGEAGNQGEAGMSAVAEVIRQRTREMKKTPDQVVLAGRNGKHAFSCLNGLGPDALIRKQRREKPQFEYALGLAEKLFSAPETLPNATKQATHFTRKEEKPWWARGHKPVVIIGAHAFYRLPNSL
jgi:spore germination cell wall hydrolase CwlJ-like protein